jgi:GNAT superfamily N-acetyltransferase
MPRAATKIHPLTPDRWPDLLDLFGPERGANSGCWCLWPRVSGTEFKAMDRDARKARFRAIVKRGPPPGLLAYEGDQAVGWCAVGPRPSLARFESAKASRMPEEADGPEPARIYAISCFFIRSGYRKLGMTRILARAAIDFARRQGASAIDACAIDPDRPLIWGEGFVGVTAIYVDLGFREIARRSPRRPLMRLMLQKRTGKSD